MQVSIVAPDFDTPALESLLACDSENVKEAKRVLKEISPLSMEAVELISNSLIRLGETFGRNCGYDEHQEIIQDWLGAGRDGVNELSGLRKVSPCDRHDIFPEYA